MPEHASSENVPFEPRLLGEECLAVQRERPEYPPTGPKSTVKLPSSPGSTKLARFDRTLTQSS